MPPPPEFIDGILLIDKPTEWTSHDVCAFVRKRFKFKKVGHAGTLDPLATGLLVVLIGKATKYSMALSSCDKEYCGTLELGVQTDSHDRQGNVIAESACDHITLERVREEAKAFTGEILQVPPMVSALKHKGTRLYKLARQGKTVPREGRKVTVHEFRFDKQEGRFINFSTHVSKGTYVRTLVNDLGEALGCHACLAGLRRIRSGQFRIEQSVTMEALRNMTVDEISGKMFPLHTVSGHATHH
ncbi:MAG: tRNA pseudouridine synthase B [Candidatus Omnitrophica bacterium ADurb.Bin292]|jgi:tRNA pseudouridine55 synthase|nr:MAG: tRNA pseudouridine synthase B [Candidatus Omnitrophica bacterium ADurb.Bin292]HOG23521.1 tRNA pseudouridine(55) synthase TruB [Candidatus Omnitrophota bacterium]HPW76900.1 tRNA pseudouridine(55) synthase TruB [Candidatus Omnitrophota bacterium]